MDRIARVGRNAVCVRAGEGGLSATGGVGAVLALVNYFGALLAHLHYYHHHHWRSHRSHDRCRRRRHLQGSVVRCCRVMPATMAAAPMIPAVPARACLDGGGV